MRRASLVLLLALAACDTMIAHRIAITSPADVSQAGPTQDDVLATVRNTLTSCELAIVHSSAGSEVWEWRNPEKPPGVQADVRAGSDLVEIRLSQGLYGPIGPTEKYLAVKAALVDAATKRVGKGRVRVE